MDLDKIVGGVALTRYHKLLVVVEPQNDKVQTVKKVTKISLEGYIQMPCTSSVLDKNTCKVSKGFG